MGEQKLLLPLRGKAVLQWVLESALSSQVHEVICVVRNLEAVRAPIALRNEKLVWLINHGADSGQSSSLIAGLWAVDAHSDGVLFLSGDQPLVRPQLIDALVASFQSGNVLIVAPSFHGKPRNPVLIHRRLFPELLKIRGDRDSRVIIESHKDEVALVEWPEEVAFMDLDDRDDYERLKQLA